MDCFRKRDKKSCFKRQCAIRESLEKNAYFDWAVGW